MEKKEVVEPVDNPIKVEKDIHKGETPQLITNENKKRCTSKDQCGGVFNTREVAVKFFSS